MNKKEKIKALLFTVIMIIVFIIITEIIWGKGSSFVYNSITYYPKGTLVIQEAILASFVLIVLLLFKNSYVFTQEKKHFKTGLFYGLFHIIFSIACILLFGLLLGGFKNVHSIFNLALGCFLIGICEEFLCRGWLLNEFLERFGKTKKGIWFSIIISGIIFGLMHIGNIFNGQEVITTIIQIISAAATGVVFGVIYYKTKNIWSVVFLHGLWDFAAFLPDLQPVESMTESAVGLNTIGMIFTILMAIAELIAIIPHIKDIDNTPKRSSIIGFSCIAFVLYFAFLMINSTFSFSPGTTYKYGNLELEHYSKTTNNYTEYNIKEYNYNYKISKDKDRNLVITNMNTNYSIKLECNDLYDYILVKDSDKYILGYIDFVDTKNIYLKYSYIYLSNLSDDNSFLDSIKTDMRKYLLPDEMDLCIISDDDQGIKYLAACNTDKGCYLLTSEDEMSMLKNKS